MADFSFFLAALIPLFGLLFNVATHITVFRFRLLSQLKSIVSGFIFGGVAVFFLTLFVSLAINGLGFVSQLLLNEFSYGALGYSYFHFVNLGETARRIRIIREISESGKSGLTEGEILQRYNARDIVGVRLQRLLNNGQIIEREGRYFLHGTPMMKGISSIILFLKVFLLGKQTEH